MNYNFLMNAECIEGFKRYKWAKLGRTMASQSSCAIDELGRIFTWGQNIHCESGQGDPTGNTSLEYIELATQLMSAKTWVKSSSGEDTTVALNSLGELWGWGDSYYDCAPFGLPLGSGTGPWSARFCVPTLCTPGYLWKNFAHDYYHTIAISLDDKLCTWGYNGDYGLGMAEDIIAEGDSWATPILNTYLTDDIKLLDCEGLNNVAVATDDKVYIWGDNFWSHYGYPNLQIPREITGLVIPPGETVIQCNVDSYYGVSVLLSNGEVWTAGHAYLYGDQQVSYPAGSITFQRVPFLIGREITKIRQTSLGSASMFAIDSDGNIWGWSDDGDWYTGNTLAPVANSFGLIAAEFENERVFIDVINNGHSQCYQAIDSNGYLWTWGRQWWGPHLAIGAAYSQFLADNDPNVTDIVALREIAGYAEDAVLYNGDPALLNVWPLEESEYIQPLPQLLRHRPCGHWHLRLFEEEELWPRNCWMPSVSIYQNHLMFVACGKRLQQGGDTGCEVIIFDYDMDANIWTLASYTNLVNAANAPGGTSIYDDTMAFANWKADASGTGWYDVQYTNFGLGVWVLDRDSDYDLNYTHFACKNGMYMQGKVAAYSGGIVAVAYENAAGQLLVQVTTDYGATWNLRHTEPALAARNDWSITIDKNGYIFLAYQSAANYITTKRSIDNGLNWTLQSSNYMIAGIVSLKIVADNDMLFLFAASATGFAIERSSNSGVSWSTVSGEPAADPHVSSGCNVDDDNYDIAFVTAGADLNNYLYDTGYGGYNWLTRTIPQISDEGLEINTYQGSRLADLAGYNGRFAYSAYTFYTFSVPYVAVALSVDRGVTWSVRGTPLGWYDSSELSDFRGCPLFCLTDVPHLNHIWTFEKGTWAQDFVKQKDKYKVEQPCVCPPYRGT